MLSAGSHQSANPPGARAHEQEQAAEQVRVNAASGCHLAEHGRAGLRDRVVLIDLAAADADRSDDLLSLLEWDSPWEDDDAPLVGHGDAIQRTPGLCHVCQLRGRDIICPSGERLVL